MKTKMPAKKRSLEKAAVAAGLLRGKGTLLAGAAVAAVALAGSAIFNRIRAKRAEDKTPPVGQFVEVDGVRLHYIDRGAGPAVVLLHGNGVLLQDFEVSGVIDLAAEQYRVIAFDRPGFGYSDRPSSTHWTPQAQAELIATALRKIGVGSATFVGHSWGTMVALAMALDRPDTVNGLVLVSGYYYGTVRPDIVPASIPAIPVVGKLVAHTVAPINGRIIAPAGIKASFSPAPISEKFEDFPIGMTLRPSQVQATASDTSMMITSAARLSDRYGDLRGPIEVIAGEGDLIAFPKNHAYPFVEEVNTAELRVIPGQGHLLHYAVPDQVVAAIDAVQR